MIYITPTEALFDLPDEQDKLDEWQGKLEECGYYPWTNRKVTFTYVVMVPKSITDEVNELRQKIVALETQNAAARVLPRTEVDDTDDEEADD